MEVACWTLPLAFPALWRHEFSITVPEDGTVYEVNSMTKDLALRYGLRGLPGATRLCLELLRGPLHFYRGPVLHRRAELLSHYARGCFAVGQPVTLQGLGRGNYR
jgi:hypothetical protein